MTDRAKIYAGRLAALDESQFQRLTHLLGATGAEMLPEESREVKSLEAFVTLRSGKEMAEETFLDYLRQHLPPHLIPSRVRVITEFPRNTNCKIDRERLIRETIPATSVASSPAAQPRNEVEQVLLNAWAAVLEKETLGIHDNFFELGGHSLLVTAVVSRIRDDLQIDLPLASLFSHPTIASLGELILNDPEMRGMAEENAMMLLQLDGLSDAEIEQMLREKGLDEEEHPA